MTITDDLGNPAVTKWNRFIKLGETSSAFMLFLSPRLWILVPKRWLGVEREHDFRTFVRSMLKEHNNSIDQNANRVGSS